MTSTETSPAAHLWSSVGNPEDYCHYVTDEQMDGRPEVTTLCGQHLPASDYAENSPLPDCPVCRQLAEFYS